MAAIGAGPGLSLDMWSSRSGRVAEVSTVTFAHGPLARSAPVSALPPPPGLYGPAGGPPPPRDAHDLQAGLLKSARTRVEAELEATQAKLRLALDGALAGEGEGSEVAAPEAWLEPEARDALPPALAEGLAAYAGALRGTLAELRAADARNAADAAAARAEKAEALVARAVRDQVDARLAAEAAVEEAESRLRLAALSLFGELGERELAVENALRLGQDAERLAKRERMIDDWTRDIERGAIQVSVSTRRAWAGAAFAVELPRGADVSVFAETRYHFALSALSLDAGRYV